MKPTLCRLLLLGLWTWAAAHSNVLVAQEADAPQESKWEAWWADLEKDEPQAARALLEMASRPQQATTFLKPKMRPLKLTAKELRDWLEKLGSDQEDVWKGAFEELEYLDPRLAIDLEDLMLDITTTPTRQRMVEVLGDRAAGSLAGQQITLRRLGNGAGFNFRESNRSWWAEHLVSELAAPGRGKKKKWTRAIRGIVLLEHIGTPQAVAILNDMASGHQDAAPTKLASEALERLSSQHLQQRAPLDVAPSPQENRQ